MSRTRTRTRGVKLPPAPVAGFVSDQISGIAPLTINITDQSTDATSWSYTCTGSLGTIFTSTSRNPSFLLSTAETWTIAQTVTNRTDTNTLTRTNYVVTSNLTDFGSVSYMTARVDGGAGQWTQFGVAAEEGAVIAARKTRLLARYPAGAGGTVYPVQIDHMQSWPDGSLRRATISMQTPPGYTALSDIEIGYSDTLTPPGAADWAAIRAANPAQFTGTLSIFAPAVYFFSIANQANAGAVGDTLSIELSDGTLTRTYSRTYEHADQLSSYVRQGQVGTVIDLVRDITLDATGRWRCFASPPGKVAPAAPQGSFVSATAETGLLARLSQNVYQAGGFGASVTGIQTTAQPYDFAVPGNTKACFYVWGRGPAAGQDPEDFTATATINAGSAMRLKNVKGASAGVLSGPLYKARNPSPRVSWTFDYNDAGAVVAYASGWRNGAQVHERIVTVPLRNAGSAHPFLRARMRVTWDTTGARVDHQVCIENCLTAAYAKDVHYDVLDITVNGVNQIAAELSTIKYKDLIHIVGAKWRWRQARAFALCDPVAFMKARFIPTWKRNPTRNLDSWFAVKTQGASTSGDFLLAEPTDLAARGGYERAAPNHPLYFGNWKYNTEGGGCGEIGISNSWSWAFWANDVFAHWPQMEACGDNNASAYPWHFIDETSPAGSNWQDAPPHPYLRHEWGTSESRFGSPTMKFGKAWVNQSGNANLHNADWTDEFSLYGGFASNAYGFRYSTSNSHAPHTLARDCWLATGEEVFHRNTEMYSWAQATGSYRDISTPKSGGTNGDVDHRICPSGANGNRTMAWSWRAKLHSEQIMFDAHPRRSIYVRVLQDFSDYFAINVSKTVWGAYNVRSVTPSSNYFDASSQLAGDVLDGWGAGLTCDFDAFKSYYVTAVAGFVADTKAVTGLDVALTANQMWWRKMTEVTDPYRHFGSGRCQIGLSGGASNPNSFSSPNGIITDDLAAIEADVLAKTDPSIGYGADLRMYPVDLNFPPDFGDFVYGGVFAAKRGALGFVPNYVKQLFHLNSLLANERHTTNASHRSTIAGLIADFRTKFPETTVRADYSGWTYELLWNHMNQYQPWDTITQWRT